MKQFIALILLISSAVLGLDANDGFFRNISSIGRHGNLTVRQFHRDKYGFCWMGADGMLVRFDGAHLQDFPLPMSHDNSSSHVTAIGCIGDNFILAGTSEGLWRLSKSNTEKGFERVFENEIDGVSSILEIDDSTIGIGTSNGLKIYNSKTGSLHSISFSPQTFSSENDILAMTMAGASIYAVCRKGIVRIDRPAFRIKPIAPDAEVDDATSVVVSDGKIFVGSLSAGLKVFDPTSGKYIGNVDVGCNVVTSLSKGKDGDIYVGTDGNGVLTVDAKTMKVTDHLRKKVKDTGQLTSGQVYAVLSHDDNELWIGYYQGGADYKLTMGDSFRVYKDQQIDTYGKTVRAMAIYGDEMLLGTREGLFFSGKNYGVRHISMPRLRSDMVLAIFRKGGLYYVGTYGGGLSVYDPISDKVSDVLSDGAPVLNNGHVFSIAEDSKGALWFGTSDGLVKWQNGKISRRYDMTNSQLPDNNVFEIYFDSSGNGWVGTGKGLAVVTKSGEMKRNVFQGNFVDNRSVRYIFEDSSHNLYFVSEKGPLGVSDVNHNKFHDVDPNVFNNANVKSLTEDSSGNLWVVTDGGILQWDGFDSARRYGFADGILNPVFLSGHPVTDDKGMIYVGNPEGLICFNPDSIQQPASHKMCAITAIFADDDEPISLHPIFPSDDGKLHVQLSRLPQILRLDFSSFLYTKPEIQTYEYSTDLKTWHSQNSDMSLALYSLHYGTNTIWVRNVSNPGKTLEIVIQIPYPMWIWFGIAGLVVVFVIIAFVVSRHLHKATGSETEDAIDSEAYATTEDADTGIEKGLKEKKKYSSNKFLEAEKLEIENSLSLHMENEKPYLNADLSVGDLAAQIGISSHRLSQYFSQHAGVSFYDYVNRYRVEEFKKICDAHKDRYTLTAMSEKAGFSSRASFFRYFKKYEGITPAEYLKARQ